MSDTVYPVSVTTPLVIAGGAGLSLSSAATAARAATATAFAPLVRALSGAAPSSPSGLILPPGYSVPSVAASAVTVAVTAPKVSAKALAAPLLTALTEAGVTGVTVKGAATTLGVTENAIRNTIDYVRRVNGSGFIRNVGRGVFALAVVG